MLNIKKLINLSMKESILLIAALVINAAAHAYFTITFPVLGRELQLEDIDSSLVLSISALIMTLSAPFWGWLCEVLGRKFVIMIGLVTVIGSSAALSFLVYNKLSLMFNMQNIFLFLLIIRGIHSALSSGIQPASQAVIADITDSQSRAKGMAMMGASFGIGTILGSMLAIISGSDNLAAGFLFLVALLMTVSVVFILVFKETAFKLEKQQISKLPLSKVWPYLLTTLLGLAVYSALQQITSWRLQDDFNMLANASVKFTGGIMMATMISMVVSQLSIVTKLKWEAKKIRFIGAILMACALIGAAFVTTPTLLLISMSSLGFGLGMLLPGNLAVLSLSVNGQQQGQIGGLNGMCQGLGLALGPVTGSILYQIDTYIPYLVAALVMFFIFLQSYLSYVRS